jgi:hypothetical protein
MNPTSPTPEQQSTLRDTCVLVDYHGGFANWKKRDVTASIAYSEQATNSPQSYTNYKNIFVNCDGVLASIKGVINEARAFHYTITLPAPKAWGTAAFISNALVPTYRHTMTQFQLKLDSLKTHLANEWDSMKKAAHQALGNAYNDADYGNLQEVLDGCYINVDFRPVPSAKDVTHPTLGFIKQAVEAETALAYDKAILDLWARLLDQVKAAKDNLAKLTPQDGRFRTEWLDNLKALLPVLRGLNISQDAKFDQLADEAGNLLRFDHTTLKGDVSARAKLAAEAERLHSKLSTIYSSKAGQA